MLFALPNYGDWGGETDVCVHNGGSRTGSRIPDRRPTSLLDRKSRNKKDDA
jgi:hypothetical protein